MFLPRYVAPQGSIAILIFQERLKVVPVAKLNMS